MRYTLKQMREEFPNDDACLQFLFDKRYGSLRTCYKCGVSKPKYYRVKNRKAFECKDCGYQLYPLVGTIFEKTTTPLIYWLHAIYLFSVSKNGVAAKELERQVGVSYKTAHRIEKQIRLLMSEGGKLGDMGTPIEVDEAYIGGKRKQTDKDRKTPIMAALEVGGHVRTAVVPRANSQTALPFLDKYVYEGSMLHTDESKIYKHLKVRQYYNHQSISHIAKEFVRDGITTNHVEGFFGQLKRSLDGTYHAVSPHYLSEYVAEFAFRYNHRNELIFPLLLAKAAQPRSVTR
jgi:transposase